MEQDREINQVLMNVKGTSENVISVSLISARAAFRLLVFLMRLAKKGLVAAGISDGFKDFARRTGGNYTVYNVPLSAGKAERLKQIHALELKLQNTKSPAQKTALRNEIRKLYKEIPELAQLKKLQIDHCVLPKLNGPDQTIQVAIAKKSDQPFKNWYLNHLTEGLSGGKKGMEEMKAFTEGNYTIFNLPFEGNEMRLALSDFDILGMNYAELPDLKVGDGNSQVAVPNADRGKLETWFNMWKDKQLREGKEPGEMYAMDQESYMETSRMEEGEYVAASEPQYKEADAQFEEQARKVPWKTGLQKENSEEYIRYMKDDNYEKITINDEMLVDKMHVSSKAAEMRANGYFISRMPGTYGERQQTLILPKNQVFVTDDGKTYLAFLPKNQPVMIANAQGNIRSESFGNVYEKYEKVTRGFKKVAEIKEGIPLTKDVAQKVQISKAPKL